MVDCSAEALKVRAEDALDELCSGPDDRELEAAKKLVESLRNAREYEVMGRLAEAISRVDPKDPKNRRLYAQCGQKHVWVANQSWTEEAKLFVVNALACYETPSAVAEAGSHSAATSTTSRSPAKLSGCTASTR